MHGEGWLPIAMISDPTIAAKISSLMMNIADQLDESIALVMGKCSAEEVKTYKRSVGRVMGELLEILNPLYAEHPQLKPPEAD